MTRTDISVSKSNTGNIYTMCIKIFNNDICISKNTFLIDEPQYKLLKLSIIDINKKTND